MHLLPQFGNTIKAIEADGFTVAERVDMMLASDSAEGIAKAIGLGTIGFAQAYGRLRPDLVIVLGDRFEILAAVSAALPFRIPVAHIAGGEITEGALDDNVRHAASKLSHLHFVSTEQYRQRLLQMGEEPWRVHVTGSPSIDSMLEVPEISLREVESCIGFKLERKPLLVTLHPETQCSIPVEEQVQALLTALEGFADWPIVFTASNADPGGQLIMERIYTWVKCHANAGLVHNLGTRLYYNLLRKSAAAVGNSSSGIVEAPSFRVPVVNIGNRQKGRPHVDNIIDVTFDAADICQAIRRACSPTFREGLVNLQSPFGDGHASQRIVEQLESVVLDERLLMKKFYSA
jgi:UDP-N-acetylglucosamine 2-epimerase (non-hydrolysing)/GDP/UDP-N,N'-diacetylbacillosamine 2-epimerase (hydrolysing)